MTQLSEHVPGLDTFLEEYLSEVSPGALHLLPTRVHSNSHAVHHTASVGLAFQEPFKAQLIPAPVKLTLRGSSICQYAHLPHTSPPSKCPAGPQSMGWTEMGTSAVEAALFEGLPEIVSLPSSSGASLYREVSRAASVSLDHEAAQETRCPLPVQLPEHQQAPRTSEPAPAICVFCLPRWFCTLRA